MKRHNKHHGTACVIGSGPNGLAAAITLAQRGFSVDVFEAESVPGGAARTLPLTLPGFLHDFGSAVHPLAAASPFLATLPLAAHGLVWIHSPAPLAHPLDDGHAVTLERELDEAVSALGKDGARWNTLIEPFVTRWVDLAPAVLGPLLRFPRDPFLLAHFGLVALPPANLLARLMFSQPRTRALFAGMAAHSFLDLRAPLSAAFGVTLGVAAHVTGWPIPQGGSQAIADSLCRVLFELGGKLHTCAPIDSLDAVAGYDLVLCDVSPRQFVELAGKRLSPAQSKRMQRYRYGPGAFKVDYALSAPIPWKAAACSRAATVHVGGRLEEITASEACLSQGRHSELPFVLVTQPSLFDPSRAPEGKHVAWAYCHVPNGSTRDMLGPLEVQIERFAPGFRDCVLARRVLDPAGLERMDSNLSGGDIMGGAMDLRQVLVRPTWRGYSTPVAGTYLCSASTPPGGGVHGMCGYHAANLAIREYENPHL